ncbi:hypothetical protein [Rhodoferax sp.]
MGRTQKHPDFHHVVMLRPKAIIQRPPVKASDTSNVIEADEFPTWHQNFLEKFGGDTVFRSVLKLRSIDTLKVWGKKLKCNGFNWPDLPLPPIPGWVAGPHLARVLDFRTRARFPVSTSWVPSIPPARRAAPNRGSRSPCLGTFR